MSVDKTRPGLVLPTKRYRAETQEAALRAAGFEHIIAWKGSWRGLFRGVKVIRPGDVVGIYFLSLITGAVDDDEKLPPSGVVSAFAYEVRHVGATLVEVYTGRTSETRRGLEDMVADAVRAVRAGRSRLAPGGYAPRGRPPIWAPTVEDKQRLRPIWRSREYNNDAEAAAAIRAAIGIDEISPTTIRQKLGRRFVGRGKSKAR